MQPAGQPGTVPPIQATTAQPPNKLGCMKALAITELILGIVILIFGCVWYLHGIWDGALIIITAIIGIIATCKYEQRGLNICYFVCLIGVTVLSLIAGILYIVAVISCSFWGDGYCVGLTAPPLILIAALVAITITASVFTGMHVCRSGRPATTPGVVYMQQPQAGVVYGQPGVIYAGYPQQPGVAYVQQPGVAYVQQPGVGYAQQPAPGYALPPQQQPPPYADNKPPV